MFESHCSLQLSFSSSERSWLWEGHCISWAPVFSAAKWEHNFLYYVRDSLRWSNEVICVTVHLKMLSWGIILCAINNPFKVYNFTSFAKVCTGETIATIKLRNIFITLEESFTPLQSIPPAPPPEPPPPLWNLSSAFCHYRLACVF